MATRSVISDSLRRPGVGASIVVWRDGRFLLIRRASPPFAGVWSMPAGSVEPGETVETAALRELHEETGVTASALGLATYLDVIGTRPGDAALEHHFVLVVLAGLFVDGEAYAGDGIDDARWITPSELSDYETTPELEKAVAAAERVYRAHLAAI